MITLIIGNFVKSQIKALEMFGNKTVFRVGDCWDSFKGIEKELKKREIFFIKNLDSEMLFEGIVECLEKFKNENIETIAITYRDDIIEAYEDDEDVNIIDLRGE